MKLHYFRGKYQNFGDDLNNWLMPKVFPDFFDDQKDPLFLAIGSIINDEHPEECQKIVFGSGFGGYSRAPILNERWHIYGLRGPRTAKVLGLGNDKVAGDSAILINRHRPKYRGKLDGASFMPHWQSIDRGNWQMACKLAGVRFIDPRDDVDKILSQLEQSSVLVTEAMHGAIVADALRVPWVPTIPIFPSHRFKWFDWAEALDMNLVPHSLWPTSSQEAFVKAKGRLSGRLHAPRNRVEEKVIAGFDKVFSLGAAARLYKLARAEPVLSSDVALDRVLDRLESDAERIKVDYS